MVGPEADIVILDATKVGLLQAAELCRQAMQAPAPKPRLLVLGPASPEAEEVYAVREAGAQGYVAVDARPEFLCAAVLEVMAGHHVWHDPDPASRLPGAGGEPRSPVGLSGLELKIVRLVAEGWPDKVIADRLALSEGAVNRHLDALRDRHGLRNRAHLAAWAVRHGLL